MLTSPTLFHCILPLSSYIVFIVSPSYLSPSISRIFLLKIYLSRFSSTVLCMPQWILCWFCLIYLSAQLSYWTVGYSKASLSQPVRPPWMHCERYSGKCWQMLGNRSFARGISTHCICFIWDARTCKIYHRVINSFHAGREPLPCNIYVHWL